MDTNTKDIIFLLPENQYNLHPGTGTEQDFVIVIRSVEYQPELLIQLEAILKAIQVDLSQRATIVEILNDTDCRLKEIYPVSAYVFVFGVTLLCFVFFCFALFCLCQYLCMYLCLCLLFV